MRYLITFLILLACSCKRVQAELHKQEAERLADKIKEDHR